MALTSDCQVMLILVKSMKASEIKIITMTTIFFQRSFAKCLLLSAFNPLVSDDVHRRHCFFSLLPLMTSQDIQNSLVVSRGQGYEARKVVSDAGLNGLKF